MSAFCEMLDEERTNDIVTSAGAAECFMNALPPELPVQALPATGIRAAARVTALKSTRGIGGSPAVF